MLSVEEEIEMLTEAGLLTERQAEAFVYREVEAVPREAAAEEMGITASTLDDYRSDAVEKVKKARATVTAVETIRFQADRDDDVGRDDRPRRTGTW
ncbi:hypothetical protein [Natrarchaeobius oligotrophus]|uniref:RNA polymerase sigma factor 70 region 4 type 2 domain-containing protein n=1 Tax=Natrarchaeobius chitinivorans TaxID=1679083 RepID=A0A3N6LXJ9_NATCH|nr:hypothetical protein [Natrarchaeobius chitinivorans]RQG93717.1 hypothetical protein EA472_22540 [Natrarchaeobius chitinivorans]